MRCSNPFCSRRRAESPTGTKFAFCDQCTRRLLTGAFGPDEPRGPVSWAQRAEAGTLPPLVVGGVPVR